MQIGLILNKILIQAIWEIRAANVSPDTSKEIIMDSNALAEILNEALMGPCTSLHQYRGS
jgi:hypothetical protein